MHNPDSIPGPLRGTRFHFLIANGHTITLSGLQEALNQGFENANFSGAPDNEESLRAARVRSVEAILFEVTLPGRNGPRTLSNLNIQSPATPVLVVTLQSDEKLARPALAAGAAGSIGTSAPLAATLGDAVGKVIGGGMRLSEEATRQLLLTFRKSRRTRVRRLFSPHELEVFAQTVLARSKGPAVAAGMAKAGGFCAGEERL